MVVCWCDMKLASSESHVSLLLRKLMLMLKTFAFLLFLHIKKNDQGTIRGLEDDLTLIVSVKWY